MFRNKHFNAIITKFLLVVTVFGLLLPVIGGITVATAVSAALIFTFAAYFIADLIILSQYGNRLAVLAEFLFSMAVIWEVAQVMEGVAIPLMGVAVVSLLIGCGEWYYHVRYLARLLYRGRMKP